MNASPNKKYKLRSGVFSRKYVFPTGQAYGIAYHTPSQTVTSFEDDSANVWASIWESHGDTTKALDYILQNGTFENDPRAEASATLDAFISSLIQGNLLLREDQSDEIISRKPDKDKNLRHVVDPEMNPEQEIAQVMADHRILHSLTLEVTYSCNEQCLHCYLPENKMAAQLSLEQLERLLTEFKTLGGFSVLITGGEPLVRKDIIAIFDLVKKLGLIVSLNSNLTLMTDSIIDAICGLYPRSVGCSIYSADPDLHDTITQMKGSFNKSIEAIRRLRDRNIPVVIKAPLMSKTAPHWRELEELSDSLGCEIQYDLNITAKNDGGLSPLVQRVDDPAVLADIFSNRFFKLFIRDEAIDTISTPSPEAGLCGAGAAALSISPDGTIYPCIALINPLGRYPENSLAEVWNHSSFFKEFGELRLKDVKKCRGCADFKFCSRCPGAWKSETGSITTPPDYTCTLAQAFSATKKQNE